MPDADTMQESMAWHPKVASLHQHWLDLHPHEGLPGRQHFDPMAIPRLLPNLWLLDVERDPLRFRYRLVGTKLAQYFGYAVKGSYLGQAARPYFTEQHLKHYETVVGSRVPHYRRGPPAFAVDHSFMLVERLLLPMATDGVTVDLILALTVILDEHGREV